MSIISKPEGQVDAPNNLTSQAVGDVSAPNTIPSEATEQVATPNSIPSQPAGQVAAPNAIPQVSAGQVGAPNSVPSQPAGQVAKPNDVPSLDPQPINPPIIDVITLDFKNQCYAQSGIPDTFENLVDFARASDSSVITDGVVTSAGVDVAAIGDSGFSLYGETTNLIPYSEELTTGYILHGGATRTIEQGVNPDGSTGVVRLTNSGASSSAYGQFITGVLPTAADSTVSVWVRASRNTKVRIGSDSASFEVDVNGEWQRLSTTGTRTSDIAVIFDIGGGYSHEYIEVWGFQGTETDYIAPYIKTEAAQVTRSSDVSSIPSQGVLPTPGGAFTIVCDALIPISSGNSTVIRSGVGASIGLLVRRAANGNIQFSISNGTGLVTTQGTTNGDMHRYVATFDSGVMRLYSDGEMIGSEAAIASPIYLLSDVLSIGSYEATGGDNLNGEIGLVRVIHRALTSQEIKNLGGPNV